MSKRHQSNRRKSYGRRQHEVDERRGRDLAPNDAEMVLEDVGPASIADRFAFLDPRTPRLHYGMGD